jgi:hypothetical protein
LEIAMMLHRPLTLSVLTALLAFGCAASQANASPASGLRGGLQEARSTIAVKGKVARFAGRPIGARVGRIAKVAAPILGN